MFGPLLRTATAASNMRCYKIILVGHRIFGEPNLPATLSKLSTLHVVRDSKANHSFAKTR